MSSIFPLPIVSFVDHMQIVGVLDYGLARIADLMIKHVMFPATSKRSINILVEQLNQDSDEKSGAILSLISSSEVQVCATFLLISF